MWLLQQEILTELRAARDRGFNPTDAQVEAHVSASTAADTNSRLLSVAGSTAEINVRGVLTDRPNFMAFLFGGGNTTYGEIRTAIAEAEANPEVSEIVLAIDSGGGTVAGMFETVDAVGATSKPTTARVANMAASAAFALATAADKVVATNRGALFGSVGTAQSFWVSEQEVTITSTQAPKKIPDVTTEDGVAAVREELDAVHALFVEGIAAGRGVTSEKVNENFGQGAVLLAQDALNRGMIDSVVSTKTSTALRAGGNNPEVLTMDRTELQAKHPELVTALVQEGIDKERNRVEAHLIMGDAAGAMDVSIQAIKDGDAMTDKARAQYMAAGMNKANVESRQDDDDQAETGAAPTGGKTTEAKTAEAGFAAIMQQAGDKLGLDVEV